MVPVGRLWAFRGVATVRLWRGTPLPFSTKYHEMLCIVTN